MAKQYKRELQYTGTWWFNGSERLWLSLPLETRERLSFEHTGCLYAFPSWSRENSSGCVHGPCQVKRGEKPAIAIVNGQLRYEAESGWLRFISDRTLLAQVYRAHRKNARATGVYDIWSGGGWALTVGAGIGA